MNKTLKETLTIIKPTKEEEKKLQELTQKIINSIKIPHTEIFAGGSGAKGTWLKGNHDIDLYIRFSKEKYVGEDISKILGKHLNKKYKISKLHGSRDYYQTIINGITIEFIPLFHINHPTEASNITDISPLHTIYVKKYKRPDEIRLFKAFAKAQNVYGAESYQQGLSGYVCEILVIHYGNFEKTIKAISKWKENTHIGNKKHIENLNTAKKQSPLILIDPVDSYRNAAAAVGQEQYDLLRNAARNFLKKPEKNYFIKEEITYELLVKKHQKKKILVYNVTPIEAKKDVTGAKLKKGIEYITQKLKEEEFIVEKTYWAWNFGKNSIYYFVINPKPLSYTKKHYGPPKNQTLALEAFKNKWKKYPLKQGEKVYVEIPRKHQLAEDAITSLIRTDKAIKNYLQDIKKER